MLSSSNTSSVSWQNLMLEWWIFSSIVDTSFLLRWYTKYLLARTYWPSSSASDTFFLFKNQNDWFPSLLKQVFLRRVGFTQWRNVYLVKCCLNHTSVCSCPRCMELCPWGSLWGCWLWRAMEVSECPEWEEVALEVDWSCFHVQEPCKV